jgi:CubicO group peptidase (beta-lactamase class C family)
MSRTWRRNATRRLALALPLIGVAYAAPPLNAQNDFRNLIRDDVEAVLAHWNAPGVAISVVRDGELLFAGGFGTVRAHGGQPVDAHTLTTVASVTKAFNGVVAGMLVDDGLLHWDDPVITHVPDFRFAERWRSEQITVRDLLAHRTGLPFAPGGLTDNDFAAADVLALLPDAPPRITFRERMDYSQVNLVLFAEVVRRVSGRSWSEFVAERLLEPLGMRATYAGTRAFLDAHPDSAVHGVMGRSVVRNGAAVDTAWTGIADVYSPAGGIVTTASDMAAFMARLLDDGSTAERRLLSDAVIAELFRPVVVDANYYVDAVAPTTRLVTYGLGWIAHQFAGSLVLEHAGTGFGNSVVALLPETGVGVFVSTGANDGLDSIRMVSALKFLLIDHAHGRPPDDWIGRLGAGIRR